MRSFIRPPPISPADGLPYVGRIGHQRHVHAATGYAGNGMTSGTLAALILSDEIRDQPNPWAELLDARRWKPLASARAFILENVDFPRHLVGDRLPGGGSADLDAIEAGQRAVVTVRGETLAVYRSGPVN